MESPTTKNSEFLQKAIGGKITWIGRSHLTGWLQKGLQGVVAGISLDSNGHMTFEIDVTNTLNSNGWHCPDKVFIFTKARLPDKKNLFDSGEVIELNESFNHIRIILI